MTHKADLISAVAHQWQATRQTLDAEHILQTAIDIQQIPAPTFAETVRAEYIEGRFRNLGLQNVHRDALDNVYGWLGGSEQVVIVSAHLDTVFPIETDLSIRREKTRVYGPGLGDNSLGVAALLWLIQVFSQQPPPTAICFVANTREEGLGNLDGMRAVLDHIPQEQIKAVVVIEGIALGRVYHGGIAVRRLKISAQAEGGHSWLNFGKANAIHALSNIVADIYRLPVPVNPLTTYNVGLFEGGHSVNSIATNAHFYLDLRSTAPQTLKELEMNIRVLVNSQNKADLKLNIEVVGNRPAGAIPTDHPLVQLALAALAEIGIEGLLEQGSTDANIVLACNIPAVVVGITQGGNAHRLDEFIETSGLSDGLWQLVLLVGAASSSDRLGF